ncbi:MAG: ABC transporter permease subunit [Alphaproteobacteria bacterium]|nr:ABC transporter permease subunit [Alphaproteobacteria bacterium]
MNSDKSLVLKYLYDTRTRSIIFQVLLILSLIFGFWWIVDNTAVNLSTQNKSVGFSFLSQTAGFAISDTLGTWLLNYEVGTSTYLDVYFIGIANTFLVAFLGIIFATILGFTFGIMRLSQNFVLRSFSTIYIELTRNIPLLVQLFFWYFAVLRSLPNARGKVDIIPDVIGINIVGLYLPSAIPQDGFSLTMMAFAIAVVITLFMKRWASKRQQETGQIFPVFWVGLGVLIGLPLVVFFISGSPLIIEYPEFKETGPILKRGFQKGVGMVLVPEMLAVWLSLSLYTAAFIAEIVRAGIMAVNKGQTEASLALGLKPNPILRLVIIPQAMRVIIPPLTSQYLNLTKNSSLAIAIAYPELVSVFAGTALNQVGKEIEMIFMMMSVYLTFSILTSMFMNWFNARVKLVER